MRALSAWGAILFGFASILFITPLAALAVQRLPLGSPELTLGLAVFCCMPTTLSSGVSLTQVTRASRHFFALYQRQWAVLVLAEC